MSDPKLSIDQFPLAIRESRPVNELTDAELHDAAGAFSLLVVLAERSQEQLTARRYSLVAAGDQLYARQRDLDEAAHPSRCDDYQQVAEDLAALHGDLAVHVDAWEELEVNQRSLTAVLDAAVARSRQITDELTMRRGGGSCPMSIS